MVDLTKKPYWLNQEKINWVKNTLAGMTLEEKVGQLFCPCGLAADPQYMYDLTHRYHVGGVMCRAFPYDEISGIYDKLQKESRIPLLLASNLESGGKGQVLEGTVFGTQMQVAATGNTEHAYHLGTVCGREAAAVGGNWAFAPVMDLNINFRNPITNTRTYGSDPDTVLAMGKEYFRGLKEQNVAASVKHFPGDGMDDRDQHLLVSVNSCSVEEWDATYGKVYRGMIEAGAQTVMVGHIMLPAYSKELRPEIQDEEIMPASLAPEIMTDLLRGRLGFNGLTVTDATTMAGFTQMMTRKKALPYSVMAGADMILFTMGIEDDYRAMLQGVRDGILTEERLEEAVTRILGTKAALGLDDMERIRQERPGREVIGCEEHRVWSRACAEEAITLVKNKGNILPLSAQKYRKILLITLGRHDQTGSHSGGGDYSELFRKKLEEEGFEVTRFYPDEQEFGSLQLFRDGEHFVDPYDLILYFANEGTFSSQTEVRVHWSPNVQIDSVRFLQDKPHVFISVAWPYHLQDVPRVPVYINCYTSSQDIVEALVEKLMGRDPFTGVSPVDPFCGYWDARL